MSQHLPIAALFGRAVAQHQRGDLAGAEALYRQVLDAAPQHVDALYHLGVLFLQRDLPNPAAHLFAAAIKINPSAPPAHVNLAYALRRLGRPAAALESYDRAIALDGRFVHALLGRGDLSLESKRSADALADFERVLGIDPSNCQALDGRGLAFLAQGQYAAAFDSFNSAVMQGEPAASLLSNRATALVALSRHADALADCERALALAPQMAETHFVRANAHLGLGQYSQALQSLDRALELEPEKARAAKNRGNALHALGRHVEALASFDQALALDGRSRQPLDSREDALLGRAACLSMLGRHADAAAVLTELLARNWSFPTLFDRAFHEQLHCCDWNGVEEGVRRLTEDIMAGRRADNPFSFLAVTDTAAAQKQCAELHARSEHPEGTGRRWTASARVSTGRIRIAYLSADFHEHATSQLAAGLFEAHDRSSFEITGISFGPETRDGLRARIVRGFEHFVDFADASDAAIFTALRDREIDIAVDLKGYTAGARPGILARRPAPVQISYLGYPGTMGADWIDYLIADRVVVPDALREHYSEAVVRLPHCYQVNDSRRPHPAATPSRSELGLPASALVFACFNASYKLTPAMWKVWMRLLRGTPGSVLWLLCGEPAVARNLRAEAVKCGVDPERLIFAPRVSPLDYLARQRQADLFLDTFPINAHTTSSDALWMGLPVLTLAGESFASRVAASILTTLGVPELITTTIGEYERTALALATSPQRLSALKQRIEHGRAHSPLFDTPAYCRDIEAAYRAIWDRHVRGLPPAHLDVGDMEGLARKI